MIYSASSGEYAEHLVQFKTLSSLEGPKRTECKPPTMSLTRPTSIFTLHTKTEGSLGTHVEKHEELWSPEVLSSAVVLRNLLCHLGACR